MQESKMHQNGDHATRKEVSMKVLVTGAAGYFGSVLTGALLAEGHEVLAVDSFVYRQTSLLEHCADKRLTIVRGDARDKDLMAGLVVKADAIFPLACLTGAPLCSKDPIGARTVNFEAVDMLLGLRSASQPIIFPTTNSGYGVGQADIFCTEETPLRPISLYGRLKADIEKKLLDSGSAVTFRFATLFGASPRMRMDLLVNDFVYRAMADRFIVLFEAHFKRNYLHVRDAARAFLHGLKNFPTMKGRPFNVGLSDANLSKWELCEEIKKQLPNFYFSEQPLAKDPDQRNYIVSNERIEATGYRPMFSLTDGIAELIKAYTIVRANPYSNV
jgi:nucleoside-diphosphate-sugar epimerase